MLLICILRVLLSHSFIFFRFYFFINVYMVLFMFNNVIYVFLLLWLCILIVCLCMATLTEVFPCFFLSCKANARVKPAKTGHVPHSSLFLCCSIYVLCCSMYFCVALCTVCFVSFSVLFVYICVLNNCHRVATQFQLNISYHNVATVLTICHADLFNTSPLQTHVHTLWSGYLTAVDCC